MSAERGVYARKGYEAGRRAERFATAEWFGGFADNVADLVVLSYLDGRAHAGDDLDEHDEERAARARELHERAALAYRVLGYEWQRQNSHEHGVTT